MTTPVPWSMKKLSPICAPGCISMPVAECAIIGDDTRGERCAQPIEIMGQAMVADGRIAHQHFIEVPCRRIAFISCKNIAIQQDAYLREVSGKFAHNSAGMSLHIFRFTSEVQLTAYLIAQSAQRYIQRMPDIVIDAIIGQSWRTETIREQRRSQSFHYGCESLARRQLGRIIASLPVFQRSYADFAQLPQQSNQSRAACVVPEIYRLS